MHSRTTRTSIGLRRAVMAGVLASATAFAAADEIKVNLNGDDVPYPNVKIGALREGVLYFTLLSSNSEKSVPLESLVSLKVDKYPEYDQANTLITKNDLPGAEKVLSALNRKITEDYMKLLVGARLVYVLDWSGKFNDAVKAYVDLLQIERGPFATNVRPRNYPKDPAEKAKSAVFVEQIMRTSTDRDVQDSLKEILDNLKDETPATPADPANPGAPGAPGAPMQPGVPGSAPPPPPGAATASRDPVMDLLASKQYEKALTLIEERMRGGTGQMSTLLLQRGDAEAGLGRDMDAALSYMRVVVHFPRADQATTAMVETGKIMQKLGKADQARKLWTEAKERAKERPELSEEIDKLLGGLKG